jgi:hypothetical protein
MASSGKKKTTMAKLDRERRMRERRLDKQARKDARKQEAAQLLETPDEALIADESDDSEREPALQTAGAISAER